MALPRIEASTLVMAPTDAGACPCKLELTRGDTVVATWDEITP